MRTEIFFIRHHKSLLSVRGQAKGNKEHGLFLLCLSAPRELARGVKVLIGCLVDTLFFLEMIRSKNAWWTQRQFSTHVKTQVWILRVLVRGGLIESSHRFESCHETRPSGCVYIWQHCPIASPDGSHGTWQFMASYAMAKAGFKGFFYCRNFPKGGDIIW